MISVVFSTDHNYVIPTGVTITSLLLNKQEEEYDIYILISKDVTTADQLALEKQVETLAPSSKLTFIEMGNLFQDGFEIREISTACYYRLMIPWLIPNLDKVIYSDVDVIFKTNLKELYDISLDNYLVAGSFPNSEDGWKSSEKYFAKLGLDYRKYINSGILVINSKLQREESLNLKYEKLTKNKYLFQDQDIINIACKNRITYFDKRYNLNPQLYASKKEYMNNLIIHYAGEKPWKNFTYAWQEWWNVYFNSQFFDYDFYHKVSQNILNPKAQFKNLIKKSKSKFYQIISQYK